MQTKKLILRTFATVLLLTLTVFICTSLLLNLNQNNTSLKEAISISASSLGAFSTLGAAYLATKLFNKWQDIHNKSVELQLSLSMIEKFEKFDELLTSIYVPITTAYDSKETLALQIAIDDFCKSREKSIFEIHISLLKATAAIEYIGHTNGTNKEISNDLKLIKSQFKKFSTLCLSLDKSNVNNFSHQFLLAFKELVPFIQDVETKYVYTTLKNLKA